MNIRTGGGIANKALLNSLCKLYKDHVDFLAYEECLLSDPPCYQIAVPAISLKRKVNALMSGHLHRFHPWLEDFLLVNHNKYSHCIINTGLLGEYTALLHKYGIKVLTIHHNYEVEFQKDNKKPATLFGYYDGFVSKQESKAYQNSDMNLFLTEDDKITFSRVYGNCNNQNTDVVIGIFEDSTHEPVISLEEPLNTNRLAICGSLNSQQTIHGLLSFRKYCLDSLIDSYHNNFNLIIAGRNPNKEITSLSKYNSNITIIPNPEDMSEIIKDCGIFICPTDVGGGIKLRIIDGLKMGMPILTHEISARGYNKLINEPWFQVYSDLNTFRRGLERIIQCINDNRSIRKQIYNSYLTHFSYDYGDFLYLDAIEKFLSL